MKIKNRLRGRETKDIRITKEIDTIVTESGVEKVSKNVFHGQRRSREPGPPLVSNLRDVSKRGDSVPLLIHRNKCLNSREVN